MPNPSNIPHEGYANNYIWQDSAWMHRRKIPLNDPLNIYEIHGHSWKRQDDGNIYSRAELADELIPYLKQMGFTHLEWISPAEHPFCHDEEYKALIDALHTAGLGIILSWNPVDFSQDDLTCICKFVDEYHPDGLHMILHEQDDPAFFRELNGRLADAFPTVMRIAEDRGTFSAVTTFENGGLGFTHRRNTDWMNNTLYYAAQKPENRQNHHEKMTSPLLYAFRERHILSLFPGNACQGEKSLLERIPGDYWQKFASARAFLLWQMTQPGQKLTLMGSEIGQFREWSPHEPVEWFLLDYDMHAAFQLFAGELNHFYLEHPPLWQNDNSWDGFRWIDADNRLQSVFSYRRIDREGKELIVLVNFTPAAYEHYRIGVPFAGIYEELLNSDSEIFGGSGVTNTAKMTSDTIPYHGLEHSLVLRIPPLGGLILRCAEKTPDTHFPKKQYSH